MQTLFDGIYSSLTVFAVPHCNPYLPQWSKPYFSCQSECLEKCFKYDKDHLEILKQWKRPIDIIIVQHAYHNIKDEVLNAPWNSSPKDNITLFEANKNDVLLMEMMLYYEELEKIARDVVMVPTSHYDFVIGQFEMGRLEQKLQANDKEYISKYKDFPAMFSAKVDARVEALPCKKCMKIKWKEVFCKNGSCTALDDNNVSYFADCYHTNYYGAHFFGQFVKEKYDNWMKNNNNITANGDI